MTSGKDIVLSLLIASEKAACIARACRQNEHLLSLLIEEKKADEKNSRFVQDFKTLADVLVQELIKYDLGKQYSELRDRIYGEESNSFTNTIGESVTINLNESEENTIGLLNKVLDGDTEAAELLTECVHSQIQIEDVPVESLPSDCVDLCLDELAIWIDPIDSTAEYINGENSNFYSIDERKSISLCGLNCVTVLIGVFDKNTGIPIVGVINQPFHKFKDNRWFGRCFWGFSMGDCHLSSIAVPAKKIHSEIIIAISSSENKENRQKLENAGFKLLTPAGAGYKILCVILSTVDAYVLSQGTTYYWDTCGCHAILKGIGGNIWNYEQAVKYSELKSISYREKSNSSMVKKYSNKCGIIVCKDENLTKQIVDILK